ncbi:DUF2235 domain-containing protein [Mesorhizobium sp. CA5]|uniref:T6SS phospholipase effector Tle1-like catalytic domain-containing protein n=1 Tax=Mesorhizobium sp. CA5 TaxID=2876638 RepID=UPI00296229A5|nr:DUF2235 domain-containing protein [Mesorhizobium sp. CA5]
MLPFWPAIREMVFDGTGNDPTDASESQPTNVFNLNTLIAESRMERRRPRSQVTFYLPGIGTQFYVRGGMLDRTKQVLFGVGLDEMVMRAYVNLACNYRDGDDVVIIGFSRGAVAARLFARLITDFGLLKQRYVRFFTELFDLFDKASKATRDEYLHASSSYLEGMKSNLSTGP